MTAGEKPAIENDWAKVRGEVPFNASSNQGDMWVAGEGASVGSDRGGWWSFELDAMVFE